MSRIGKLEVTANVSIIACALVFAALLVHNGVLQRSAREAQRPYQRGERIEKVGGLETDGSSATLLLVVRSTCHFCAESVPFYHRLLEQAAKKQVRAVAVVYDRADVGSAYVAASGLRVQQVVALERNELLRVTGTPTLILLDKSGTVVNSWVGKLASDLETEVIEAVRHAG